MDIQFDWQTAIALFIVATAIGVLARKAWKSVFDRAKVGCGTSCRSCPVESKGHGSPLKTSRLVQLEPGNSK